ncbi:DNA-binding NarL/FixJ family response regulator [Nocardia tenerifensis]|uniref:DNA-binding NarL/FixJ family response regulator n=1 Tax=Nocardia tenerifensis TaxID=228006 RepID=A0A318KE22_9NOCA|nr:response regulator transcription factor [Nocardia tenerifensis]PXX71165.1 DNA-binding NarL/FixJ family response regulator [Nocardia tenerifensis]
MASSFVLALTAATLSVTGVPTAAASPSGVVDTHQPVDVDRHFDRSRADVEATTERSTISVLLADNHVVFRSGVRAAIGTQPDIECVAEVDHGLAAIREIERLRPDVALLDLDMPGLDGPAVDAVAALGDVTRILTLTTADTDENLYRALCLGASGFLVKTLPSTGLISAIRMAARGDALIDPNLTRRLVTRLTTGIEPFPAAPEVETLTAREHQVLLLIAKAYTNPEIAAELGVGEQTVKTHVSNVLAKLGVRDRVHAAVYAHTRRIVPLDHGLAGRIGGT